MGHSVSRRRRKLPPPATPIDCPTYLRFALADATTPPGAVGRSALSHQLTYQCGRVEINMAATLRNVAATLRNVAASTSKKTLHVGTSAFRPWSAVGKRVWIHRWKALEKLYQNMHLPTEVSTWVRNGRANKRVERE